MRVIAEKVEARGDTIERIIELFSLRVHSREHEMAWLEVKTPEGDLLYRLECGCSGSPSDCPREAIRDLRRKEVRRELARRDQDRSLGDALRYLFGELDKHRFIGQEEGVECITADLLLAATIVPPETLWPRLMEWLASGRLKLEFSQGDRFLRGPAFPTHGL